MKILSNKKWEEINQRFVDYQLDVADLEEDCKIYLSQISALQSKIETLKVEIAEREDKENELLNTVEHYSSELEELTKKVSSLKRLCTKSCVDYSKIFPKKRG